MKKIITVLSVLLPLCLSAQVSFNFEEGSTAGWIFNAPGRWDTDGVNPINGLYSLHHVFDNSEPAVDVAIFSISGLCPDCGETAWEFTLRHGADPSSSNKWSFILSSNVGIEGILPGSGYEGYVTGVNLAGYDDTLRLWHIVGGKISTVITTGVNWQNDIGTDGIVTIRVTRSSGGEWHMDVEPWGGEKGVWNENQDYRAEEGTKAGLWKYTGICYTYTSTRDRLLWLDDVSVNGVFIADTLPPVIVSIVALTPDILEVTFDEEPDTAVLEPANIKISGGIAISSVEGKTPETYELHLVNNIENRVSHDLTFETLCDPDGNCSSSVSAGFIPVYGVTGDVVISEIMADPSPPVQLPDDEYLELANLTADSLSLCRWFLIADNDTVILPALWIRSNERLILCSPSDVNKFSGFGRSVGLAGFPLLNDGGETLSLRDSRGALIHAVTYSGACYKDEWRSGGGWSMEMTDMSNPFNAPDTWRASVDPSGGTPGRNNSLDIPAPDTKCPEIIAAYPLNNAMIRIVFDETVTGASFTNEWDIDGIRAAGAVSDDIADRAIIIILREPLTAGRVYSVTIPMSVSDFAGRVPCRPVVSLGLAGQPFAGDILFNEILFDPVPPCNDYIELYNNSEKIVDLSLLFISSSPDEATGGSPALSLSTLPRQLLPGRYVALTTDRDIIADYYTCSDRQEIYQVRSLPSMPDDEGGVVLLDREMNVLDRMEYRSTYHMDYLTVKEGIALEKVSPELPSGYSFNWHSASELCNWGTPGTRNSAVLSDNEGEHGLSLSSVRISPDGDGFEDVVSVKVVPGGMDNVVTVTLFSAGGYAVRHLAERFSAGEEALFVWDGTGDDGERLPAGLYMIMAQSYNSDGQTRRWKKVCALLYR